MNHCRRSKNQHTINPRIADLVSQEFVFVKEITPGWKSDRRTNWISYQNLNKERCVVLYRDIFQTSSVADLRPLQRSPGHICATLHLDDKAHLDRRKPLRLESRKTRISKDSRGRTSTAHRSCSRLFCASWSKGLRGLAIDRSSVSQRIWGPLRLNRWSSFQVTPSGTRMQEYTRCYLSLRHFPHPHEGSVSDQLTTLCVHTLPLFVWKQLRPGVYGATCDLSNSTSRFPR